jgi:hypothetical protein
LLLLIAVCVAHPSFLLFLDKLIHSLKNAIIHAPRTA